MKKILMALCVLSTISFSDGFKSRMTFEGAFLPKSKGEVIIALAGIDFGYGIDVFENDNLSIELVPQVSVKVGTSTNRIKEFVKINKEKDKNKKKNDLKTFLTKTGIPLYVYGEGALKPLVVYKLTNKISLNAGVKLGVGVTNSINFKIKLSEKEDEKSQIIKDKGAVLVYIPYSLVLGTRLSSVSLELELGGRYIPKIKTNELTLGLNFGKAF